MAYWSGGRASAAITALLAAVPAPSAKHQSACLSSLPGCLSLVFFLLPLAWFPYRRKGWWGDCSYRGESSFCEDSCLLFDSLFLYLAGGRGVPGSLFWVVGERVSEVWAGLVRWWIGWRLIKVWRHIRGATLITQCFWYLEFISILQDVKRNVDSTCSLIESSNLSHV